MISLLISIPAILLLIATVLICMARGVKKSVIRLVTVILALLVSIPVAQTVAKKLSGVVSGLLAELFSSEPMIAEILSASPTLEVAPEALSAVFAAPIIYLVVFILLALLTLIVHKILTVVLKKVPDFEKKALSRGLGAAVGVIVALVLIIGVYAPISGYVGLVDSIAAKAEADAPEYLESVPEVAVDALGTSAKAVPFAVVDTLGGKALFRGLTTGKLNGEKFTLESEIDVISDAGLAALEFVYTDVTEYGESQISAIETVKGAIAQSTFLSNILPELLSSASNAWVNGEEFAGIAKPSIGEQFDPLLDDILVVFTTSDKGNIEVDIDTLGTLFSVTIEKKILANIDNTDELIAIFSNSDTVKQLTATLGANPRMKHLVPTITNIGLGIVYSSLGIPETNADVNAQFIASLATAINDCSDLEFEEMADELTNKFNSISKEYALDIPENEIEAISIGLAYDFAGLENITEADVQSFFDIYAEYINSDATDITSVPVPANVIRAIIYTGEEEETLDGVRIMFANADNLENTATDAYDGVILTADKNSVTVAKGKVTGAQLAAQLAKGVKADDLGDDMLDEKTKEVYKKSEEKHKETRQEPNLYKKDEKKDDGSHKLSTRIPVQEEMIWSGDDADEETYEKIGEVVAKAAEVVATTDFSNLDLEKVATSIGGILDGIADISEEMEVISDNIVKGALLTVKEQALPTIPTATIIDIADGLIALTKQEETKPEETPDTPAVTTTAAPVTTAKPATVAPVTTAGPAEEVEPAVTTAVTTTVTPATTTVPVTTANPATPASPSTSYEDMFSSAGKIFSYVQALQDGTEEEKKEILGLMIGNIDTTLASVLAVVVNDDLIMLFGLPAERVSTFSSAISSMLSRLASDGVTQADRNAVNSLFSFAGFTPTSEYEHAFTANGEAGALKTTAKALVRTLDKSPIVADAAIDIINGAPDLLDKLSIRDKEELAKAAEDCEYSYLKSTLESIAK